MQFNVPKCKASVLPLPVENLTKHGNRAPGVQPEDLSFIPEPTVEKEKWPPPQVILWPLLTCLENLVHNNKKIKI